MQKTLFLLIFTLLISSQLSAYDIKGRGASFPAPLYRTWISDFYNQTDNRVNFTQTGSGDGIKSVRRHMVDFGASDKPLSPRLIKKYDLYMFPTVIGAIVLSYNLPGVKDGELRLSVDAVAGIFEGSIQYWDDPLISKENPSLTLPHKKIIVIVRADKSGTTFNFTHYLSLIAPDRFKASKLPHWKAEVIGGKSNSGVSANIKQLEYSIGYVEYSYKIKLGLKAAQLQTRNGKYVPASMKYFQEAIKYASWSIGNDFYALIAYPEGKEAYPIVAATFILLPRDQNETNQNVTRFFDYVFKHGDKAAIELGYVPLPDETKDMVRNYWKRIGVAL